MQRNWIGRSEGAQLAFDVPGVDHEALGKLEVYTTARTRCSGRRTSSSPRAPAAPRACLARRGRDARASSRSTSRAARKSELDRTTSKEKTGVFTGCARDAPAHGRAVPVWVADYVLAGRTARERWRARARRPRLRLRHAVRAADRRGRPGRRRRGGAAPTEGAYSGAGAMCEPRVRRAWTTNAFRRRGWREDRVLARGPRARARRRSTSSSAIGLFRAAALLGRAVPGDVPRRDAAPRRRPARAGRAHDRLRPGRSPATSGCAAARERRCCSDARPRRRPKEGRRHDRLRCCLPARWVSTSPSIDGDFFGDLEVLDARGLRGGAEGARDEHDAAVGGLVLVLPALRRPVVSADAPWSAEAEKAWLPVDLYVGGAEHAVLHLLYARFWHKTLVNGSAR